MTSSSLMKAPCTRMALLAPLGSKSMSPRPRSFSAPPMPRIVRLSTWEATAKAMREGTFALIRPVMTSTDGRCVAMTRWMPAARASCVRRQIFCSTSPCATIIRSASSSMMTTICGRGSRPFLTAYLLYPFRSRTTAPSNRL